ncbi:unnamed protein product [Sympodiomycopsis kandeliae]
MGKSWQFGFEWAYCRFCSLETIEAWCKEEGESSLAEQCRDWFATKRKQGNEFMRTGSGGQRFLQDIMEEYNPWPPMMDCTMFFMPDERALNLKALRALQGIIGVPPVLRTDVAKHCYIVERFQARPFSDVGMGIHPPDLYPEAHDEMISRLFEGLKAIHKAGWTLGDIRPESIFIDASASPEYKETWSENGQELLALEFVKQDFHVYFCYFGRASDSKVDWEERVASDEACLQEVVDG